MKSKQFSPIIHSKSYLYKGMYIFHLLAQKLKPRGIFIVIHGFPSWSSKNYDIAEHLCLLGYEVFIPHHKGLGLSKGNFSFKKSISDIEKLIKIIKREKPELKISLLGHSWGGYVSLQLHKYVEEHLILLAPLIEVPLSSKLSYFVNYFFKHYPSETKTYSKQSLKREFIELQGNFAIAEFVNHIKSRNLLLLHGKQDDLIPIWSSTIFAKKLSKFSKFDYVKMNEDHRLSKKRNLVFEKIKAWLKKTEKI
jgi:alpha-beta hydrolase superfamily lysophospholipase